MTVRRAINLLVDQGVVTTAQGKGTFVKPLDMNASSFNLACLHELIGEPGHHDVKLIQVDLESADDLIASKLSVERGKRVIFISRIIERDRRPVLLHKEYLLYDPTIPSVESEMEVTRLMGLLEGRGKTTLKKGEFTIKAVVLKEEDARLLDIPVGEAAIRLEHTFYDFSDRKISWGWFLAGTEQMEFTARAGIWD